MEEKTDQYRNSQIIGAASMRYHKGVVLKKQTETTKHKHFLPPCTNVQKAKQTNI